MIDRRASPRLTKVSPSLRPLLRRSLALITKHAGTEVQSIYLQGSASTGGFRPRQSDLDLTVVLRRSLADPNTARVLALRINAMPEAGVVRRVELKFFELAALQSETTFAGDRVAIALDATILYGDDVTSSWLLPATRRDLALALVREKRLRLREIRRERRDSMFLVRQAARLVYYAAFGSGATAYTARFDDMVEGAENAPPRFARELRWIRPALGKPRARERAVNARRLERVRHLARAVEKYLTPLVQE